MRAIRAKFTGAPWFDAMVGVLAKRAALSGRTEDGFPHYLRNLQDDLVVVVLGAEVAEVVSEKRSMIGARTVRSRSATKKGAD